MESSTSTGVQPQSPLRIVVLGGGATGWLAALTVLRTFNTRDSGRAVVTVVEIERTCAAPAEATLPFLRGLFRDLALGERDLMRASNATFRHGMRFEGWLDESSDGTSGHYQLFDGRRPEEPLDPGRLWLAEPRLSTQPDYAHAVSVQATLCDHMLGPQLECSRPYEAPVDYGYQLDPERLGVLLRDVAIASGVRHVTDPCVGATQTPTGRLRALRTLSGVSVDGDFFIDCSGTRRALIGGAFAQPFLGFGGKLPCDQALTLRVPIDERTPVPPYTRATAHPAGWAHEITLAHSRVLTVLYSSAFATAEQAGSAMRERLGPEARVDDAVASKSVSGRHRSFWVQNCVAIGGAGGWIEPLEAGELDFAAAGLRLLARCALPRLTDPAVGARFNARMAALYDEAIELSALHYQLTQRTDTAFWRTFRAESGVPDQIQQRLCLRGPSASPCENGRRPSLLFGAGTYRYLLAGMGRLRAQSGDRSDIYDEDVACATFRSLDKLRAQAVRESPDHARYIRALHTVPEPRRTVRKVVRPRSA